MDADQAIHRRDYYSTSWTWFDSQRGTRRWIGKPILVTDPSSPTPTIPVLPSSSAGTTFLSDQPLPSSTAFDITRATFLPETTAFPISATALPEVGVLDKLKHLNLGADTGPHVHKGAAEMAAKFMGSAGSAQSSGWQGAAQGVTRNLPAIIRDPAVAILGQVSTRREARDRAKDSAD